VSESSPQPWPCWLLRPSWANSWDGGRLCSIACKVRQEPRASCLPRCSWPTLRHLAWKSEIETYNQGFNLYRAEAGIPAFTRVNADLIPSQATEVITSAVYEFTDTSVSAGVTYDYYIESIDMQALPTQHGSATVQVPQNGTGPSSDYSERVFLPFIRR
jgi:hypothetical protein